jgi:hypothetical protein
MLAETRPFWTRNASFHVTRALALPNLSVPGAAERSEETFFVFSRRDLKDTADADAASSECCEQANVW